ncbi:PKD domain-containing protein [Algibacter sp. AS12]|uniref:PKD domain-containing protein n=1 Tax=Algibacter sp. AS12 TaxID=3135773 RepID=UPI00398B093F
MKKYNIILIAFLALFNCGPKDDFEPLSDLVVADLFTPSLNRVDETTINNIIPISVNDFSSLADLSQGVVSRSWSISPGTRFLKDTFQRKDSLNLEAFIDPELNSSNWRPTVHVLFQEPGEKIVTLNSFFPQPVSYLGKDAVQVEDLWRLSNSLTYDVYARLNAEASITNTTTSEEVLLTAGQNPSATDTSGFTTLTLEAGTTLNFKDLSTIGRPDGRVWNFESGTPETSEDQEIDVLYNRPGEYSATITVNRNKKGKGLFFAEQTKTLPVIVKIIPSTQPFVISNNGMAVDDNNPTLGTNILSFPVNGIVETVGNSSANFTVDITNGSFTTSSSPSAVRISSSNGSVVELVLSEPIYNSDTVTISYNGTSIESIDQRTLEAFTNVSVDNLFTNFLTDVANPSMETSVANERNANTLGYGLFVGGGNNLDNAKNTDGSLFIDRSTERSSDGNASLKFNANMPFDNGIGFLSLSNTLLSNSNIPAGDYMLTFDMYIENGSDFEGIFQVIQQGEPRTQTVSINAPNTDEWFTVKREFTAGSALGGNLIFNFRDSDNPSISGRQVFYLDNLQIIGVEKRP